MHRCAIPVTCLGSCICFKRLNHAYVCHTFDLHIWAMTRLAICVPPPSRAWPPTYVSADSFAHTGAMTYFSICGSFDESVFTYVRNDSSNDSLILWCAILVSPYVCHDSFIRAMCAMTHSAICAAPPSCAWAPFGHLSHTRL